MNYRIKHYDPVNDIYILQQRFLWILWRTVSVGPKARLEKFVAEQEKP